MDEIEKSSSKQKFHIDFCARNRPALGKGSSVDRASNLTCSGYCHDFLDDGCSLEVFSDPFEVFSAHR